MMIKEELDARVLEVVFAKPFSRKKGPELFVNKANETVQKELE